MLNPIRYNYGSGMGIYLPPSDDASSYPESFLVCSAGNKLNHYYTFVLPPTHTRGFPTDFMYILEC